MHESEHRDEWDEFQWEKSLRESDTYAAKYFRLLKRFCDLPGASDLIADRLGADAQDRLSVCDLDCESCPYRWDCEIGWASGKWQPAEFDLFDSDDDDEETDDAHDLDAPVEPGDPLFFESDPTFNTLRQAALGWCNIYAAILPSEARPAGMRVLFEVGRALANLAYSVGDGMYEYPAASIAFAKRSLAHLNRALGEMDSLARHIPRLRNLLSVMRRHLMKARDAQLAHLTMCRTRKDEDAA